MMRCYLCGGPLIFRDDDRDPEFMICAACGVSQDGDDDWDEVLVFDDEDEDDDQAVLSLV